MKKSVLLLIPLVILTGIYLAIHFPPSDDQASSVKSNLPSPPAQATTQTHGLAWSNELQLQLPEIKDTPLAGVAPFLAHEFEDTPPTPTSVPTQTIAPTQPHGAIPTLESPEPDNPILEGLKELSAQSPAALDTSRIFGARSNGAPPDTSQVGTPTPIPEGTGTPKASLPRVSGVPAGYSMLYLMNPKARLTVERELSTILDANLENGYLGTLVDGTFGEDFDYLESIVRRLNEDNRTLTLVLYLTNGATMRRFASTPIKTAFSQIDPAEFRGFIQYDSSIRNEFLKLAAKAKTIFDLNRGLNAANSNIAVVMLEDNLDQDSYRAMRDLARSALGKSVRLIRNPCQGCYDGNDSNTLGDGFESHNPDELSGLSANDGFSMDGVGFASPIDDNSGDPSPDTVKALKLQGINKNIRYFGLWRKKRQGLGDPLTHPDNRTYEVPSDEQKLTEIDLLRYGLL